MKQFPSSSSFFFLFTFWHNFVLEMGTIEGTANKVKCNFSASRSISQITLSHFLDSQFLTNGFYINYPNWTCLHIFFVLFRDTSASYVKEIVDVASDHWVHEWIASRRPQTVEGWELISCLQLASHRYCTMRKFYLNILINCLSALVSHVNYNSDVIFPLNLWKNDAWDVNRNFFGFTSEIMCSYGFEYLLSMHSWPMQTFFISPSKLSSRLQTSSCVSRTTEASSVLTTSQANLMISFKTLSLKESWRKLFKTKLP